MDLLEKDFPEEINLLKEVCSEFKKSQFEIKELNEIVNHLKNTNMELQQSEAKHNESIKNYNTQINTETKLINDYYKIQKDNEILKTKIVSLNLEVHKLEQKINQIVIDNEKNVENIRNNFKIKEKNLEERIEALQASYTLDNFEKENDIEKLRRDYEQKLENAVKREQNLKIEIFDIKHQMDESISKLNQKISELQEKNKPFENKTSSNYSWITPNFISARNVYNTSTSNNNNLEFKGSVVNNSLPINSNSTEFLPKNNQTFSNKLHNSTQVQNTVNISNIESNSVKKFHFRKPAGREFCAKKLLSENFDPFKMHLESISSNASEKNTSSDIIDTSLTEIETAEGFKIQTKDNLQNQNKKVFEDIDNKNNTDSKCKRRKLFDPNNFDYL